MFHTIIVEDNRYMQKYLAEMLSKDGDFTVDEVIGDSFEAEKRISDMTDLVLMDVQTLHNHSGIASGKRIKEQRPQVKVVIVTSLVDPDILVKAKIGAADSLWYKDHGSDDLLDVIRRTMAGERVFPDSSPEIELKEMFSTDITPRQMQVLRLFVLGYTYDQIAENMNMTKNGVRWNLDQIIIKGGFNSKHELLAAVLSNKLIVDSILKESE